MYLTKLQKEEIKSKAITELFKDKRLKATIQFACVKHGIPLDADIQNDILQVVFENLCKYDTVKFVDICTKQPHGILKLAKSIVLRKGIYSDVRSKKYWTASIAQQIIYQSTLNTPQHISSTDEDTTDNYNLPQVAHEDNIEEVEQDNTLMWEYVRQNLTQDEKAILYLVLQPNLPKMKGKLKKDYQALLPKLKIIITEFKNLN